jgi:hypothetical protein
MFSLSRSPSPRGRRQHRLGRLVGLVGVAVTAAAVSVLAAPAPSEAVAPKQAPMTTPWTTTAVANIGNPLPEYPRPQMTRADWQSLNGEWQFANASAGQAPPVNQTLAERINVPYPIESALSGIQRHQDRMWYRRTFTVPTAWNGRHTLLNFGAVDQQATVYINGIQVGSHVGGYDGFQFDITANLHSGSNEIIVGVYDPTDTGSGASGKQRLQPGGISYTATSGIWQTVWLEPANAAHITRLDMTPDVAGQALNVVVRGAGISGQAVQVTATQPDGAAVATATGSIDATIRVPIANPHLWSPDDPYLYNISVALTGTGGGDSVGGYFGMRSIGLKNIDGVTRIVLNGNFVFENGMLDQGFWPDGIYTAPTDDALKSDIQQQKNWGFNMIRKHIKVEPQRWYYWADKLGMLVWQDMPAMVNAPNAAAQTQWLTEYHNLVNQHLSSPSIVMWIDQNEGWGTFDPAGVANTVKGWDPSRLVDNMSGVNCCGSPDGGNGDVWDYHTYTGPDSPPPTGARANVLGEYGGLGLIVSGHEYQVGHGFGYEMEPDSATLTNRFLGMQKSLNALMTYKGLNAAVYTEPYDVETESNGFMTYDRQVVKVDANAVRAANQQLIAASKNLGAQRVSLPINASVSIQSTGSPDRYIRHQGGVAVTSSINGASSDLDKQDATFTIRPGLAHGSCVSFESRNYPGSFLRQNNGQVIRAVSDGTSAFAGDATFCPIPGNSGSGTSFLAWRQPSKFLRLYNGAVWVGQDGAGNNPAGQDTTGNFMQDTSWNIVAPWTSGNATATVVATGNVRSGLAGKCLDVPAANNSNGTPATLYDCNTTGAQQWSAYTDGSLRALGKCLDVYGAGTANSTKVQIWDCNGGSNQQWQPYDGAYRNPVSDRCLDVPNATTTNGTALALWDCNGGAHQAWTTPGFTATQTSAGPIRSAVAGKCIDVQAGNSASGTPVQLYDCNGTAAQQWAAYTDHSLRALGKCLQSVGAQTAGGTKLQITDCSGTQAQQWVQTNGSYQNTASSRCIDDPGGTANNGTQLQIYDCNGSPAQKWSQPGGTAP